jgi:serine/threonine-protein kinase
MDVSYGRYELRSKIAQGGMAEVFLAFQRDLQGQGKPVAIKRLMPYLSVDPEFVRLFLAEARLTSKLSHRNLCKVLDLGEVAGSYYLALEYLAGKTLERLARTARNAGIPITPRLAAHIVARAADGLSHAHQAVDPGTGKPLQVVHRDVSPQNLFVTYDGQVKVLDFGIARIADRLSGSSRGRPRGTPSYMSPEQVAGLPMDARSDVFALGVVAHELLSGRPLFRGDTAAQTKHQVLNAPLPPLPDHPGIPEGLRAVVEQALRRDPAERIQSAQELAARLDAPFDGVLSTDATTELAEQMGILFAQQRADELERLALGSHPPLPGGGEVVHDRRSDRLPRRRQVAWSVGAGLLMLAALGWALIHSAELGWTDTRWSPPASSRQAGDFPSGAGPWR